MTKIADGHRMKVDWIPGEDEYSPECRECTYFEHTYCDFSKSDHHCHMLHPTHPACKHFVDRRD